MPQRAILQGAKSHFVWVLDDQSKPRQRVVEVGEWHGDDWFVTSGLKAGERVIVDGAVRVGADSQVRVVSAPTPGEAPATAPAATSAPGAQASLTQTKSEGGGNNEK